MVEHPRQAAVATLRLQPDRRIGREVAGPHEPLEVPPQRRRLAGDAAPGVLARRQVREVAPQDRAPHTGRGRRPRSAPPRPAKPRTSAAYAATVCSDNEVSDRPNCSTRQAAAASSARRSAGGTGPRVFVHVCTDHDTTGSNQPPESRTQPARSSRASAIAASATGRSSADDDVVERARIVAARRQDVGLDAARQRPWVVADRPGAAGVEPERHEHVVGVGDRRRAVAQQLVGAGRGPVAHRARHRHHLDRALDRGLRRDQRPASLAALDDDQHLAERGEDAVAQREAERLGRRARRPLRQQQARARTRRPTAARGPAGTGGRARCRRRRPGARPAPRACRGGPHRRCPWPGRRRRRRLRRPGRGRARTRRRGPPCVALRVPTMPTRRPSSTSRSPRVNSTAGGSGSSRSCTGYVGSTIAWAHDARRGADLRPLVGRPRAPIARQAAASPGARASIAATAGDGRAVPVATAYASSGS